MDGLRDFLRGTTILSSLPRPQCHWENRDGLFFITLPPSDGTGGAQWIERLKAGGFHLDEKVEEVMTSEIFQPTQDVIHRLVLLPMAILAYEESNLPSVMELGKKRGWKPLHPEAMCILRENFWDESFTRMGGLMEVIGIHAPVKVDVQNPPWFTREPRPHFLRVHQYGVGGNGLDTVHRSHDDHLDKEVAVAWELQG